MSRHEEYGRQVRLLLRIMPLVYRIQDFAVHGGTAINLFHRDMPRYSVDVDVTYVPLEDREESLRKINEHLLALKREIERTVPGIRVVHKPDVWKLICLNEGVQVKIEVNGTKRGLLGEAEVVQLCASAQEEFRLLTKCRTVSFSQLYGGKVSAALSRQHPRDLFDCKFLMEDTVFDRIRNGLLLCLAGSDKPIVESMVPNRIDQRDALENQFAGMTEVPFTYDDYERTRADLHKYVLEGLTMADKAFLLSFEQCRPDWTLCAAGDLSVFPSVQWKMLNLRKLSAGNPRKLQENVALLKEAFG